MLSNFASTGAVGWLVELLDGPVVPPAVEAEVEEGRDHGHDFLDDAAAPIGDGIPVVAVGDEERSATTAEVDATLDAGEAAALRLAPHAMACSRRTTSPPGTQPTSTVFR